MESICTLDILNDNVHYKTSLSHCPLQVQFSFKTKNTKSVTLPYIYTFHDDQTNTEPQE